MQSDLRRYAERAKGTAAGSPGPSAQPVPVAKRRPGGGSLVAALGSQLLRSGGSGASGGATSGGTASGTGNQPRNGPPLAELPGNVPSAVPQQPAQQRRPDASEQAAAGGQAAGQQPRLGAAAVGTQLQPCPLCGAEFPAGPLLEQHVQEELAALEQAEAEDAAGEAWDVGPGSTRQQQQQQWQPTGAQDEQGPGGQRPQRWQQQRQQQQQASWRSQQQSHQQQRQPHHPEQRHRHPPPPPQRRSVPPPQQHAPVLVLGGAPAVTAPTDRRRLAALQRQRLLPAKRPPSATTFNFFADGGSGALVSSPACPLSAFACATGLVGGAGAGAPADGVCEITAFGLVAHLRPSAPLPCCKPKLPNAEPSACVCRAARRLGWRAPRTV